MIADAEAPLTARTDRYMRAAAHAVAGAAASELRSWRGAVVGARVLALIGGGNNGADTLLAAAALARRGCAVTAALATDHPLTMALQEAQAAGVRIEGPDDGTAVEAFLAGGADLVLDGLTGIGARGALRPRAACLIAPLLRAPEAAPEAAPGAAAGESRASERPRPFRVLAVDLPSGTGVDDASLPGPVLPADRTVTFTCLKAALCLPPACHLAGEVEVIDLGLPLPGGAPIAVRPHPAQAAAALRIPGTHDHKYTRGVVGLWAGSEAYPGAALLTASGAARAGAGMVRLHAPRRVEDLVLAARPETVTAPGRCQALVLGPGTDPSDIPRAEELGALLRACLRGHRGPAHDHPVATAARPGTPVIIDAGALALLGEALAEPRPDRAAHKEQAQRPRCPRPAQCGPEHVLTPHAGEAAALLGALGQEWDRERVEAHPPSAATALSELTGATVLLKGAPTLIAAPGQPLCAVDSGPGWLATAGSGDVLAGILGALLAGAAVHWEDRAAAPGAQEVVPVVAAAVRLHALAGDLAGERTGGPAPILAMDVAEAAPQAWAALRRMAPA